MRIRYHFEAGFLPDTQNPAFWCIFSQNDLQKINQCILDDAIKLKKKQEISR